MPTISVGCLMAPQNYQPNNPKNNARVQHFDDWTRTIKHLFPSERHIQQIPLLKLPEAVKIRTYLEGTSRQMQTTFFHFTQGSCLFQTLRASERLCCWVRLHSRPSLRHWWLMHRRTTPSFRQHCMPVPFPLFCRFITQSSDLCSFRHSSDGRPPEFVAQVCRRTEHITSAPFQTIGYQGFRCRSSWCTRTSAPGSILNPSRPCMSYFFHPWPDHCHSLILLPLFFFALWVRTVILFPHHPHSYRPLP